MFTKRAEQKKKKKRTATKPSPLQKFAYIST